MIKKKLRFKGSLSNYLSAQIDLPVDQKPRLFALFAHCFTCNKNYKSINNINSVLAKNGIATFRFDFTGLGESEGDFSDTNFSSNIEDLIAASEFMQNEYKGPKLLIGHSLGGSAVLQASRYIPTCRAIVTIAAPSNTQHLAKLLLSRDQDILRKGEAEILLAGRKFKIKKQFIDDLNKAKMEEYISNLNRALLIIHSPSDSIVSISNAEDIFKIAGHPKSFISLSNGNHLMTDEKHSQYVGELISAWIKNYE